MLECMTEIGAKDIKAVEAGHSFWFSFRRSQICFHRFLCNFIYCVNFLISFAQMAILKQILSGRWKSIWLLSSVRVGGLAKTSGRVPIWLFMVTSGLRNLTWGGRTQSVGGWWSTWTSGRWVVALQSRSHNFLRKVGGELVRWEAWAPPTQTWRAKFQQEPFSASPCLHYTWAGCSSQQMGSSDLARAVPLMIGWLGQLAQILNTFQNCPFCQAKALEVAAFERKLRFGKSKRPEIFPEVGGKGKP